MKTKLFLLVAGMLSLVVFFAAAKASAYNLYAFSWPVPSALYDAHTLDSSWRSAISYGAGRWENVSPFDWRYDSGSVNDVFLEYIDGKNGTFATTTVWHYGDWITKMIMRFDNGESWYTGSGSPSSSKLDGRSVATHEFGHGIGIDHTQSGKCSSSVSESNRPTMCPYYKYGKTWSRSLESDDEDAANAQYENALFTVPTSSALAEDVSTSVSVNFSYQELSPIELIQTSDFIIEGEVAAVSETKWNQDSGLYWEETVADGVGETTHTALPFYEITIVVGRDFLSGKTYGKNVTLSVLGTSPLEGHPETALTVGDDAVFFVREAKLAWRGGEKRAVLAPVGDPGISILTKRGDGLYRELSASEDAPGASLDFLSESIASERKVTE